MNSLDQGSPQLLMAVRAGFTAKGTSFSKWCRQNGVARQNARMFVLGAINGPRAKAVRFEVCAAAGVIADACSGIEV